MSKKFQTADGLWLVDRASLAPKRLAIVVSSYNDAITEPLRAAAERTCLEAGIAAANLATLWVPGAWELPLAAQHAIESGGADGVVALGCVIRGETTHDRYINAAVSQSLMDLGLRLRRPIGFGLLTVNSLEQAQARAGGTVGNKGEETAAAVLQMLRLLG